MCFEFDLDKQSDESITTPNLYFNPTVFLSSNLYTSILLRSPEESVFNVCDERLLTSLPSLPLPTKLLFFFLYITSITFFQGRNLNIFWSFPLPHILSPQITSHLDSIFLISFCVLPAATTQYSTGLKNTNLGSWLFRFYMDPIPYLWPWESYLSFLCLSFLIDKSMNSWIFTGCCEGQMSQL